MMQRGRGAQVNPGNRFEKHMHDTTSIYLDEVEPVNLKTQFIEVFPKSIVSENNSPDVPSPYSINPYQGCEHGCTYCYARNSHEYWGYNMGQDFESKILVKKNAAELLADHFSKPIWKPAAIMLSGNTDCYQPAERKFEITRKLLEVFATFQNPVSVITKNALILRDLDILQELASKRLLHAAISINTIDETLRQRLEPRSSSIKNRFKALEKLAKAGVETTVMLAPIIPGLNSAHIPELLKQAADNGAKSAGYILVRLNGQLDTLFAHWLEINYPERKQKVLNLIRQTHAGSLNDSAYKRRMKGSGTYAQQIRDLFETARSKYLPKTEMSEYDLSLFKRPGQIDQLRLF